MRYTSGAAQAARPIEMEERSLRDVERWKDKIEVRLDNRQVFFLFFGSALVACLLFILGVIVGKRLESRGRAAAPEMEDPLALLDRVAATPSASPGLTFAGTLTKGGPGFSGEGKRARAESKADTKKAAVGSTPATALNATAPATATATTAAVVVPGTKPATADAKPAVAEAKVSLQPAGKPAEAKATTQAAKSAATTIPMVPASPGKGTGFALQLASFQTREEADAFARGFADADPYITESSIPGKGHWYRVRVGRFDSNPEAAAAKTEFERKHKSIAYIAPL